MVCAMIKVVTRIIRKEFLCLLNLSLMMLNQEKETLFAEVNLQMAEESQKNTCQR